MIAPNDRSFHLKKQQIPPQNLSAFSATKINQNILTVSLRSPMILSDTKHFLTT